MGDHKHWTVSNHNPLQTSSKSLFCKRILNTHKKQVIWLTTHSPSEHRTRPAEKKGFLGLQWVGVSYNEFRCKLKRIHRFLIESSIQPVCDRFQSFKEPSLVFQFHCIIPFIRQWHASCNINSKHKNTKILQSALPMYSTLELIKSAALKLVSGKWKGGHVHKALHDNEDSSLRSFPQEENLWWNGAIKCVQRTAICIFTRLMWAKEVLLNLLETQFLKRRKQRSLVFWLVAPVMLNINLIFWSVIGTFSLCLLTRAGAAFTEAERCLDKSSPCTASTKSP